MAEGTRRWYDNDPILKEALELLKLQTDGLQRHWYRNPQGFCFGKSGFGLRFYPFRYSAADCQTICHHIEIWYDPR